MKTIFKEILKKIYRRIFWKLYADMEAGVRHLEDKMRILQSGLWDEEFYVRESGWCRRGDDTPLDHYLTKGWREGFSPSSKFDGKAYAEQRPELPINPLVHYLRYARYPLGNSKKPTDEGVRAYLDAKSRRTAPVKKVVFTCFTGGYDDLGEIRCFGFTDPDWDYVCFTDDEELLRQGTFGIWEIRPLKFTNLDRIRNARRHKLQPHLLFPEYEESIYVDANVNILSDYLFREIRKRRTDLLIPIHFSRNCIYQEYAAVLGFGIIDPELGAKQIAAYREAGFPENYGLHETNVLYRRHHEPKVKAMMEDWLYWIENFTQRDQLSLSFVLWKHGRTVRSCALRNARVENPDFCVFEHAGRVRKNRESGSSQENGAVQKTGSETPKQKGGTQK